MLTESGPQTPDDAQVKAVLDKIGCGRHHSANYCGRRAKGLSLLPEALGNSGARFSHDDRQIPGRRANVTVRIYTPNPRELAHPVFFHAGFCGGQPGHAR